MFRAGDRVRRIHSDWGVVRVGVEYIVARDQTHERESLYLEGIASSWESERFVLVEAVIEPPQPADKFAVCYMRAAGTFTMSNAVNLTYEDALARAQLNVSDQFPEAHVVPIRSITKVFHGGAVEDYRT